MKQYGLIGFPLKHSFSTDFFQKKFKAENIDAVYNTFPIGSITEFKNLIHKEKGLLGLNVTIPYKSLVIPYLDFINEEAQKIGAVNCIKIEEGKLTGYNTDHFGFSESLKPLLNNEVRSALVLGTGGSAQAVFFVLKRLGIPYKVVSHSGKGNYNYHDLTKEIIKCHQLIINTTPLGMFPSIEEYPILPYSDLNEKHILFDLIYNPELTSFLKQGLAQNAQIKNGLEMLHFQAIKSWDIWNSNQKNSELNPIK